MMNSNGLNPDAQKLLDYFATLPASAIMQARDGLLSSLDNPACVGAHTAYVLRKRELNVYTYQNGARKLRALFNEAGYKGSVSQLLKKHGAAQRGPFSARKWPVEPYIVLREAFHEVTGHQHIPEQANIGGGGG